MKLHMHPVKSYSYVDLIISYPILIFSSADPLPDGGGGDGSSISPNSLSLED
jgi:hypothetical protein